MSTNRTQSAIAEVRDQLSLDYADSKHLNNVGANLGLSRPRVGFTDDSWRAIVKTIALHYKQIKTKFEAMLAIFFGPRITVGTALTEDTVVGQEIILVEDHEDWPQLGDIILDEGLATEEVAAYCFLDRNTHQMYLTAPLTFAHTATVKNTEQALIAVDSVVGDTIVVSDIAGFPDPSSVGDYTVVVGTGTAAEETVVVTAIDFANRALVLTTALANTHTPIVPSNIKSTLSRAVNPGHQATGAIQEQGLYVLSVTSAHTFPPEGDVILGPAGPNVLPAATSFTAIGGSASTITLAAATLDAGGHSGYRVVFDENTTTAALAGLEADVLTNTDSLVTLDRTLPASVANTDTFKIRARVHYTSVDYDESTLTLQRHIPNLAIESAGTLLSDTTAALCTTSVLQLVTGGLTVDAHKGRQVTVGTVTTTIVSNTANTLTMLPLLPSAPAAGVAVSILFTTDVEVLEPVVKWNATGESVDVAQVKSPGVGWDVIQTTPNCVEILTPAAIRDVSDIRSASYLHTTYDGTFPATTLAAALSMGDTQFIVTDPTDFPVVGVVTLSGSENAAYYTLETYLTVDAASGDTAVIVPDSTQFPSTGDIILDFGGASQETVTISANDPTTNTLTVGALANDHLAQTRVRDTLCHIPNTPLTAAHLIGASVALYQPRHGTSDVLDGNLWTLDDVFPGPYVYKPEESTWGGFNTLVERTAPSMGKTQTLNTGPLPGPAQLAIGQDAGFTALEVENAGAFNIATFPYDLKVGLSSGNLETPSVFDVNLRQRAETTLLNASLLGAATLDLTESEGSGDGDSFPSANGYRLLIDKNQVTEEVVYVQAITTAVNPLPDVVTLEFPTTQAHGAGATVELMADVLTVSVLTDDHEGIVARVDRSTATGSARWPMISSTRRLAAEIVAPEIGTITIDDVTNFPTTGGRVYLNFGRTNDGADTLAAQIAEVYSSSAVVAAATQIPVASTAGLPPAASLSALTPFLAVFDPGGLKEEVVRVTGYAPGPELVLDPGYPLRFAHASGTLVRHYHSKEELLTYTSVVGNTLSFSTPIVLQFTHSPGESAILSTVDSEPSTDGYDFPFYLPPDLSFRLQSILDLVRAAGVEVKFIDQR